MSENDEERRRAAEAAVNEAKENYDQSRKIETKTHEDVVLKLELAKEAYDLLQQRIAELEALLALLSETVKIPEVLSDELEELMNKNPKDAKFIKVNGEAIYFKTLEEVDGDEEVAVEKTMRFVKGELMTRIDKANAEKPEGDPGWTGNH